MKRVSVVGLGYIGLPTALQAARAGFQVFGFDVDFQRVQKINTGDPAIFEPELIDQLWKTLKTGSFKAFTDLQYADYFVLAVPTPFKENKEADLSYVFKAVESVIKRLMPGNVILLESTVPVGTTEKVALFIEERSGLRLGIDFFVAYCPERVLPGKIFKEIVENDRVIGGLCQQSCELARQFYSRFVKGFIYTTDDKTAEMVKLVENTSRDVQIAFANQVAAICEKIGIDPYQVISLANKHPRVNILRPTCGVGGHCIAVDPWFLIQGYPQQTELFKTARSINDAKPHQVIDQILQGVELRRGIDAHKKPRVLALGVTFKPDIDDIRESPALHIVKHLSQKKDELDLVVYDQYVQHQEMDRRQLVQTHDLWQAIDWADLIVVLVKHKEFTLLREEDFAGKPIIDTCGLLYEINQKQSKVLVDQKETHADCNICRYM